MLKLCMFIKVKVIFLVLVYVSNFDLFEFSVAILEKGLYGCRSVVWKLSIVRESEKVFL